MYRLLLILAGCSRSESFDATGTFEATEVTVSAEASGRILAFNVNEGDRIEQGQTVGTIDTVQLYLQKMQLERQIASVRSNRPDISKQVTALQEQIAQQETAPAQAPAEVLPSAIPAASTGSWSVQIGAYGVQENAKQAAAHAEMMLASVQNAQVRVVDTGKVWKVLSGNFSSKDEASQFARTVTQALGSPAFAVAQ